MKLDALGGLVDKKDVKLFLEQNPVKKTAFAMTRDTVAAVFTLIFVGFIVLFALRDTTIAQGVFAAIMLVAIICAIVLYFYLHHIYALKNAEIGLRVERLAKANGWHYDHRQETMKQPTAFFSAGHDYVYTNVVNGPDFEIGQFEYSIGIGRHEKRYFNSYMIIPLARKLPHMLLDGKSNNTRPFGMDISNIPMTYKKSQIDLLEGDFNDHYNLYAPEGYGVDARYIFTPDLMKVLVEESDSIDIEIMDDKAYVYFGKRNIESKEFWEKAEKLRTAFKEKLVAKSLRYDDDRTEDGSVSYSGARLKKGVSVITIAAITAYVLWTIVQFLIE